MNAPSKRRLRALSRIVPVKGHVKLLLSYKNSSNNATSALSSELTSEKYNQSHAILIENGLNGLNISEIHTHTYFIAVFFFFLAKIYLDNFILFKQV